MPKISTKRTKVWDNFQKMGGNLAKCKLCQKIIQTSGNTSNLNSHMTNHHKGDVPKELSSTQQTLSESFKHVEAFSQEGDKSKLLDKKLLYWIVASDHPFSMVDDDHFRGFCAAAVPLYRPPGRTKLSSMLDTAYENTSAMWRSYLTGKKVTLTTDIWTETMNLKSFLGITAHFERDFDVASLNIGVTELTEQHTAANISNTITKICDEWSIKLEDVTAVVTDNAANMTKAVQDLFGKKKHLPCIAHTLNLVATFALSDSSIQPLISKIKSIVTYFKQSCVASSELRKWESDHKIIQDVPTRWNSTYYMLERFLFLKTAINNALMALPTDMHMINGSELAIAENVLLLLRPLETATKDLSGQKYCTASIVIPVINKMRDGVKGITLYNDVATQVRRKIITEIDKRFGQIEQVTMLATATILDPRFKKLLFNVKLAASAAIRKLSQTLNSNNSMIPDTNTVTETNDSSTSLWNMLAELHKQQAPSLMERDELSHYLTSPLANPNCNPLKTWESAKNIYPNLYKIALEVLPIVATSVPSERLFSAAGRTITQFRNRLSPEKLTKLLFLSSLKYNEWK